MTGATRSRGIELDVTGNPTTVPIPFFNIETNSIRPLILVPLTAMDGALYHCYETLEECKKVVEDLRNEVQINGGTFVILYHNNSKKHLF